MAPASIQTIDASNFRERIGELDKLPVTSSLSAAVSRFSEAVSSIEPIADKTNERSPGGIASPIGVFAYDVGQAVSRRGVTDEPDISGLVQSPPDLTEGVPEPYRALVMRLAVEEGVDPRWVFSIMRAENAGFDPMLISPAGAVGLMQVIPNIGTAFGAQDLTDPEQNIRAGTRFLRVLIDKYRNPVLVASAYNAGEPRVDMRNSLPLIRETADYVTRVVGFYTGTTLGSIDTPSRPPSPPKPRVAQGRGRDDRARSQMLVFSISSAGATVSEHGQSGSENRPRLGGPVKIVKEEVLP